MVTGGARGIGAATALGFARLGANVVIASRSQAELEATAKEIEACGVACLARATNIRDLAAVDALKTETLARFGQVDFLINNAGGQFMASPLEISDNGWRSVVDLNLNGTWNVTRRFMEPMMARGSGAIVNIVHVYSFERGAPMFIHSGAARAGVVNLTRSLAPYLQQRNVTINAVAPGTTVSPAAAKNYGFTVEEWHATAERTRFAEPEEIAAILLFLCSPAARTINGAVLTADGAATQLNWPAYALDDLIDGVTRSFD